MLDISNGGNDCVIFTSKFYQYICIRNCIAINFMQIFDVITINFLLWNFQIGIEFIRIR